MAKMTVTGLDGFSDQIRALQDKGADIMKAAVFEGANVLATAVKDEIRKLPEEEGYMPNGAKRQVITAAEKQALLDHVGIARMDYDGGKVTTAIGFDGYTGNPTKKYPNGAPVALIARSIESGSSVRQKHPFMRKAGEAAKARAQQAMIDAANNKINELTKE